MQTLLPEPVAPATSKWGIFAKSAISGFPLISLPSPTAKLDGLFKNSSLVITSLSPTTWGLSFGTSIPITDFPGTGASILMLLAAKLRAKSSDRFTILLTFVPGFGETSYLVIVGPKVARQLSISILKFLSVSFTDALLFCSLYPFFPIL